MKQSIGIQYSQHGPIIPCVYDVPQEEETYFPLRYNDAVMAKAEEEDGFLFARVAWQRPYCDEIIASTAPEIRLPNEEEMKSGQANEKLVYAAYKFCNRRIHARELDMKLVDASVLFDQSKLIFYFTAPTRIDFRELVKDLVNEYRTRIELRQIGVRHETQMIGSLGNCGMICCCRRFLTNFAPVTIKMAKEQNLFLNPTKISGVCSRLLCCLAFEQNVYDDFQRSCPKLGKRYLTDNGYARILRLNMFRNTVTFSLGAGEIEHTLEEWNALNPRRPDAQPQPNQQQQQKQTYVPEAFINCSVDPEMIENDPELSMFDPDFTDNIDNDDTKK